MEDYKFLFKVVLVGNAGVGKTCLVRRFTQGMFPPGQGATIGVDFMIKTVEIDGEKIKVCTLYNFNNSQSILCINVRMDFNDKIINHARFSIRIFTKLARKSSIFQFPYL